MAERVNRFSTGMVLGKFMPIHKGHQYLIDYALDRVNHLTILVGTLKTEPIPGHLRIEWVRELYPGAEVHQITDENPQYPHEHPNFWEIWTTSIRKFIPQGPDVVFTSETYGEELAKRLGARHLLCDLSRSIVPISATAIRNRPLTHWQYIPETVRPYFVKRVVIYGPESTGKTTLAEKLAAYYGTVWVPEFAREYLDKKAAWVEPSDIPIIAEGQIASEALFAKQANRLLISDTDLITTSIYSQHYFGECPDSVLRQADAQEYDLYLLMDIDVRWVEDWQRPDPTNRQYFFDRFRNELEKRDRRYVVISGTYEERFDRARQAIDQLIRESEESE
jgi:NadR type nicotinamide-nucleotide adenylyltransferase